MNAGMPMGPQQHESALEQIGMIHESLNNELESLQQSANRLCAVSTDPVPQDLASETKEQAAPARFVGGDYGDLIRGLRVTLGRLTRMNAEMTDAVMRLCG